MALDEQYRWTVARGVLDQNNLPKAFGVGIENDRVILDTRGWASLDDDGLEILMLNLQAAKAVLARLREQRR